MVGWKRRLADILYVGSRLAEKDEELIVFRWNFDRERWDALQGGGAADMRPYIAPEWRHVYDAVDDASYMAWMSACMEASDADREACWTVNFLDVRPGLEEWIMQRGVERYGRRWAVVFGQDIGSAEKEVA